MKKTVALIGVDGTGKSTLLKNLQNRYGDKAVTMYMGCVRFEDKRIEELLSRKHLTRLDYLKIIYLKYKCFWYRYRKATKTGKLVLFDRYIHEIILNCGGWKQKFLFTLLYRYLFPQPEFVIYLYCSVNTSFQRKDDIVDKAKFASMKKKFDNYFLENTKCYCLDSDKYNIEQLTEYAYNYLKDIYGEI